MKAVRGMLVLSAMWLGLSAQAHEDQFGTLKGDGLELFYTDHSISGHVNEHLVFAAPLEKEFGIQLSHRANGQTYESSFKKSGSGFASDIVSVKDSKAHKTVFTVTKVDAKQGTITGTLDQDAFTLTISAAKMDGNHYVDPTYDVRIGGKSYTFQLENGEACVGCSLKIAYVVLGMLRSTGTL